VAALRRTPSSGAKVDDKGQATVPLGVIRLSLADLHVMHTELKKIGRGVKLFAGEGVAPRGVIDLDDASRSELQSIKFIVSQPNVTIRFDANGAYCTYKETKAAKRVVDFIQTVAAGRQSWLPPYRSMRGVLIFSILWVIAMIGLNLINSNHSTHVSSIFAAVGGLVSISVAATNAFMAVWGYSALKQYNKQGAAAIHFSSKVPGWILSHQPRLFLPSLIVTGIVILATLISLALGIGVFGVWW
jgi:hypothetical protein